MIIHDQEKINIKWDKNSKQYIPGLLSVRERSKRSMILLWQAALSNFRDCYYNLSSFLLASNI